MNVTKEILDLKRRMLEILRNIKKVKPSYVYVAYAEDVIETPYSVTGFTMSFSASLDYIAILSTTASLTSFSASNFEGYWKKYSPHYYTSTSGPDNSYGYEGDIWARYIP